MQVAYATPTSAAALVAVANRQSPGVNQYLRISPAGKPEWVEDPAAATAFESMREATRIALRLPGALRAFGLPRKPELAVRALH